MAFGGGLIPELLPPHVLDGLRLARRAIGLIGCRAVLSENTAWKDRFAGETVFVIGNGPSLRSVDHRKLLRHPVIVMNHFYKAEWKSEVIPVAHCIGEPPDSPAWVDPSEAINGTNSLSYWLNIASRGHVASADKGKLLHYVLAGYEPRLWRSQRIDLAGLALGFQTTAILAIEVALYMGFKDIRLVGFDHDWLASPDYSRHFYADKPDAEDKLGTLSYLQILRFVTRMWEGYYALQRAAEAHGARISNMTEGSYLDVFERRELEF